MPGPYRATLTAVDAGMNASKPAMIGFTIVRASAGVEVDPARVACLTLFTKLF